MSGDCVKCASHMRIEDTNRRQTDTFVCVCINYSINVLDYSEQYHYQSYGIAHGILIWKLVDQ